MTYNTQPKAQNEQELIVRLSDPDKDVRAEAMHGLVAIGKSVLPSCTALLLSDDWKVRYRAAEALGLIGDAEAYTPLTTALGDDKDHVRYMAAKGLGLIGNPGAVEHLRSAHKDENEFVRRSIATSLGAIGGPEAIAALRLALEGEADEDVREVIIAALHSAEGDAAGKRLQP